MRICARVALVLVVIADGAFTVVVPLVALAPKPETHFYAIPTYEFFRVPGDADNWAESLCAHLREMENVKACEAKYKSFGVLQQSLIQSNDPRMEIIRLNEKPDVGRKIKLEVSVFSTAHKMRLPEVPCGNATPDVCVEMFKTDIAKDVAGHDRLCHKGTACANH